jgi:signal transduction histidine kinase
MKIWFAFLLSPLFTLVFINELVAQNSPSATSSISSPKRTLQVTDSLTKANLLFQNEKYEQALTIALEIHNNATKTQDTLILKNTKLLIAEIFRKTKNYKQALYYFTNYLNLSQDIDLVQENRIKIKVASLLYRTQEVDSAVFLLEHITQIRDTTKEIALIKAKAFSNLSGFFTLQDKLLKAEIYANSSLEIHEKYKDSTHIAGSLNNLASVFMEQKRYRDAKRELLDALMYIKNDNSLNAIETKENIYNNLAYIMYMLKDYRAYIYAEKGFDIKDSLTNAEIKTVLTKIEREFNAENERKQGLLNTARERAEKEKETHKRIKATNLRNIFIVLSISLLIGIWLLFRYFKLVQKNKLEQLNSEAREKVLNATLDGKETERRMIANTLHDSVSTLLSSANLHLQAAKFQLKEVPEEIQKAQIIVNEAAEKIRNLSHSLVSTVLLKFGLSYAIQELAEKYSNSFLTIKCISDSLCRFSSDFELKINSIIDELLNNIIKHSEASIASIKMAHENNSLVIEIKDNGKGFNPEKSYGKTGLGLSQIEARIKKMNGVFRITSKIKKGTHIYISIPVSCLKKD